MSTEKARYPLSCSAARKPLTRTSASRLTAPKCSRVLFPAHASGIRKVRRYVIGSPHLGGSSMPESRLSGQNGTTTGSLLPECSSSQRPFRHSQSRRASCGRG